MASIAAEISPVYAPPSCSETSWAPYRMLSRSPSTSVCTRPQVGERRHHDDLDLAVVVLLVVQRPGQLLDQDHRLLVVQVRSSSCLPSAAYGSDGAWGLLGRASGRGMVSVPARRCREGPCPRGTRGWRRRRWRCGRTRTRRSRACGRRPPSHRRRRPRARTTWVSASATARVPSANALTSKTPIGPFQNTVRASASSAANAARRLRADVEPEAVGGDLRGRHDLRLRRAVA